MNAKVYFFAEGCRSAAFKSGFVLDAIFRFLNGTGLVSAGFALLIFARSRAAIAIFASVFVCVFYLRFPGALYHNSFRYLSVFIPFCWMGWMAGLANASYLIRWFSVALALIATLLTLPDMLQTISAYQEKTASRFEENHSVVDWVRTHLPPDAIVLIHDAGLISTVGTQPLIDLVGLKSPSSTIINKRILYKECRRDPAAISDIALQGNASYLVVNRNWDRIFKLTSALKAEGWTVRRADVERRKSYYEVFHITPPVKSTPSPVVSFHHAQPVR